MWRASLRLLMSVACRGADRRAPRESEACQQSSRRAGPVVEHSVAPVRTVRGRSLVGGCAQLQRRAGTEALAHLRLDARRIQPALRKQLDGVAVLDEVVRQTQR